MSTKRADQVDKVANPISSPQAQKHGTLPTDEAPLARPNPDTEAVDKVITPTSIKDKERQSEALQKKVDDVEDQLHKQP